jgi:hypothetical protein
MPTDFNSNALSSVGSAFDSETVVIDRRGSGSSPTYTVIYSGTCDFQSLSGSEYTNPAGPIDIADGYLAIDPDASGNLPAVKVGDRATVTQSGTTTTYNVVNTSLFTFPIKHLELLLKRGPTESRPRVHR